MKRIAIALSGNDEEALNWIMDSTGSNQTDAVKLALILTQENFSGEMIHKHYLELKRRARERSAESH